MGLIDGLIKALLGQAISSTIKNIQEDHERELYSAAEQEGISPLEYVKRQAPASLVNSCEVHKSDPDKLESIVYTYISKGLCKEYIAKTLYYEYTAEYIRQAASENNLSPIEYIWTQIPSDIAAGCKSRFSNLPELEKYLFHCVNQKKIKPVYKFIILDECNKSFSSDSSQNTNDTPAVITLAEKFKGLAPDHILQHCDSIISKPILVETYLNQCVLQNKISSKTADTILKYCTGISSQK